ncbi:hypothetical protein EC843_101961 [Buttiauxella sp. JUb87]|uniref:hypothetical protein n=1 Tax=Buttiauxella sp. JUb87 TaxID=2485129 RepID=UPI001060B6A1|nr:hypothetical protein [Buttiauxella sp. JUb87]TDN54902.1 hypothetical protein EC843_101961 [Buttiauxella sp. JUb87]
MHTIQVDKNKMPFFDTFKTATVVGLLMQQVSSVPCHEGNQFPSNPYSYHLSNETTSQIRGLMMDESVGFIKDLTATLNQAYSVLLGSNESNQESFIKKLDPEQTDLIELQLRGLEGAIKNVYTKCSGEQSELVKPALIATAQARASAAKLNHLISQMITHVDTFESNIDMEGLRALAKHGTNVFASGKFH